MLKLILEIARHTPLWVYAIFCVLVAISIESLKKRVVPLYRVALIPTIFTFMSLHTLLTKVNTTATTVGTWLTAIAIGTLCGWLLVSRLKLRTDRTRYLIEIPGSWDTIILIAILFSTKYYFGYSLARDPQLLQDTMFELSMLATSGASTGLFIGHFTRYTVRLFAGPSVELKP